MSDDLCRYDNCRHDWGQHDLVATTEDPAEGGIILCPAPGCQCYSTWSTGGRGPETVHLPDADEIAMIRAELQGFFEAHALDGPS